MDGREVQDVAQRTAWQLSGATQEHPFGPDWTVFKVSGKVFLLLTEVPGEPVAIMKCEPSHGLALRETVAGITPGYHMNKRHWITIHGAADVSAQLVDELVRDSYRLVVERLPGMRGPQR